MSKVEVSIKVATLNFTGINNSPFEYHDGSEEKVRLDDIFSTLLKEHEEVSKDFSWNIGKIDTILQKERYSPAYRYDAGVLRGKLVDKHEFDILWDHYYELNEEKMAKANPTQINIDRCRLLDWIIYLSLVTLMFGKVDLNQIKQLDASVYKQKLKEWHSKAYLKVKPKMEKVIDYFVKEQLSVMFLQEAGF